MAWTQRFYKSKVWQKKRLEIIRRDNKECQRCKELGRFSPAECVHHIKHLDEFPELALVDENLVSLCNSCHNTWAHPEKVPNMQKDRKKLRPVIQERWE